MAEKILKGIIFPGLEDTYIVPEVDDTLSVPGASADAKVVGEALSGKQPIGNYVKTINGNAPDENGNIEIEVGSGGSGGSSGSSTTRETILAEQALVFSEISNGNGLGQWYRVESPFALVDGAEYIVDWNGTEYDVVAVAAESLGEGAIAIGNLSLVLGDSSTDEPFIFVYGSGSVFGYATNGTYRVAIYKINTAPSSIQSDWNVTDETSPAYIKNRPFGSKGFIQGDVIFPTEELTLTYSEGEGHCVTRTIDKELNDKWYSHTGLATIVCDGVEYTGEIVEMYGIRFAGDTDAMLNGVHGENAPPIGVIIGDMTGQGDYAIQIVDTVVPDPEDTSTAATVTHSIAVYLSKEDIEPLNSKYISAVEWDKVTDKPFGKIPAGSIVVDETVTYDGDFAVLSTLKRDLLVSGAEYEVIINGIRCTGRYGDYAGVYVGINVYDASGSQVGFIMKEGMYAPTVEGYLVAGELVTFKVTAANDIITKLPSEYLSIIETTVKEVIPDSNVTFEWNGADGHWQTPESSVMLTAEQYQTIIDLQAAGKQIDIEFDGNTYSVPINTGASNDDGTYAGYTFGDWGFEDVPFLFAVLASDYSCTIIAKDETASIDTAITKAVHVYADRRDVIKSEYLPDNIGGSSGPTLPEVTTSDAGKFLRVTDEGIWAAVSIPNAEGVGF